jgi:hypothetical protein
MQLYGAVRAFSQELIYSTVRCIFLVMLLGDYDMYLMLCLGSVVRGEKNPAIGLLHNISNISTRHPGLVSHHSIGEKDNMWISTTWRLSSGFPAAGQR